MFKNKKIFVLGMARSGYEVSKLLSKYNNEILVTDKKEQDVNITTLFSTNNPYVFNSSITLSNKVSDISNFITLWSL